MNLETEVFYEGDLSLYVDFEHPKGWSRKTFANFWIGSSSVILAIAPNLRKDPPIFTSNHAPFFLWGHTPFSPIS